MAIKPKELEVPAEEKIEAPVETPKEKTVCPNCNNSGKFCAVCSSREVE
jgi:hypothetical protein